MPPARPAPSRTAVVQDWFFAPGGSEQCAIEFARLLPEAEVFTSFFEPEYGAEIDRRRVRPWPLQRLLGGTGGSPVRRSKRHSRYAPTMS
jgi:hypothetical protein